MDILQKIIESSSDIKTLPQLASKVMRLVNDPETDPEDLTKVISRDQAIAAKILGMANSPFYGREGTVAHLTNAIVIMGFKAVQSYVFASSTKGFFGGRTKKEREFGQTLWQHALYVGFACRVISRKLRIGDGEECFMCGLLHDIGKVILSQKFSANYMKIIHEIEVNSEPSWIVEQKYLDFNHSQLGKVLLEHWNFPENIYLSIEGHHELQNNSPASLSAVINISDLFTLQHGIGFGGSGQNVNKLWSWTQLDLDDEKWEKITEEILEQWENVKNFL